jgi:hypothetical protein
LSREHHLVGAFLIELAQPRASLGPWLPRSLTLTQTADCSLYVLICQEPKLRPKAEGRDPWRGSFLWVAAGSANGFQVETVGSPCPRPHQSLLGAMRDVVLVFIVPSESQHAGARRC